MSVHAMQVEFVKALPVLVSDWRRMRGRHG
jgi:hypothetical protein